MTRKILHGEKYLRTLLDAYPSPVLVMNRELVIHDANQAAIDFIGDPAKVILNKLCGDALHCMNARQPSGGCGKTKFCSKCVIRQTTAAVAKGTKAFRRSSKMNLKEDGRIREVWFLVTGASFRNGDMDLAVLTLEDVTELMELRRIIPICMHCRKVRDDSGFWHNVEDYLHKYTGVQFSHGLCPDCLKKHYPGKA